MEKQNLDAKDLGNFRPMSNIPYLDKVAKQLQQFLDGADCLDPFQSNFKPGYGIETTFVSLVYDLRRDLDRVSAFLLTLLHLSVAFDTNNNGILLRYLSDLGVGGMVLWWIWSSLSERSQKVVLGDGLLFDHVAPEIWGSTGLHCLPHAV